MRIIFISFICGFNTFTKQQKENDLEVSKNTCFSKNLYGY